MSNFSWAGFGIRLLFAAMLVFATYNPSGYSYVHWVHQTLPSINPYIVLAGLALAIGYVIYIRATLRSLGVVGIGLIAAVCAVIVWLLVDWGLVDIKQAAVIVWIAQIFFSLVLALGMSWSHVRRKLSGQVDADDVDE